MPDDETARAYPLSYCCPFRMCAETDAGRRGWLDPIHAQQHISITHRKWGRKRKPMTRRWPHSLLTYEADAWLFDIGPMREGPLETQQ